MREEPEIGDDEGSEDYWMDEDAVDPSDIDADVIRVPGSPSWVALVQETTLPDLRIVRTFDTGRDLRWGMRRGGASVLRDRRTRSGAPRQTVALADPSDFEGR